MFTPELYWVRDVEPNRLALMARPRGGEWLAEEVQGWRSVGVATVVSLLEPQEVRELELTQEQALCEAAGLEFLSFPVQDRSTPSPLLKHQHLWSKWPLVCGRVVRW